jgi:hypothetical protein
MSVLSSASIRAGRQGYGSTERATNQEHRPPGGSLAGFCYPRRYPVAFAGNYIKKINSIKETRLN